MNDTDNDNTPVVWVREEGSPPAREPSVRHAPHEGASEIGEIERYDAAPVVYPAPAIGVDRLLWPRDQAVQESVAQVRDLLGLTPEHAASLSRRRHQADDDDSVDEDAASQPEAPTQRATPEPEGARRIEILAADWTDALADAIAWARDEDTIVVRSAAMAELAEGARRRMRPELAVRVEVV